MLREFLTYSQGGIDAVLDEMERVLGDMPMNVSEFASVLEEGISSCKISLLPMCPDEVLVGDIAQERIWAKKMVLALGMTDDVPGRCQDSAILSSGDIRILTEGQGAKTREETEIIRRFSAMDGAERVNERTRETVCMNLCAFTERLYLSSPLGQETEESEILRYIHKAFRYEPEEADNDRIFLGHCAAAVPMAREQRRLEALCEDASVPKEEIALATKRKNALEKARQESPEMSDGLKKTPEWQGREPSNCISRGEDLFFGREETVSPTLLETYCECPFWNFAQRGLHLREREETAMRATESGDFVHETMKEAGELIKEGQVADEADCKKKAEEIARGLLKEPRYSFLTDTKAGKYTAERLVGETAEIAAGLYRQIANSGFEIYETEFEIDEKGKDHGIGICGRIDRIDKGKNDEGKEYIRIVDYKTGSYDTSASKYYTGEKLQLELYMASVLGDGVPAGMYYFPAKMDYVKAGQRSENVDLFRMDGFTNDSNESMKMSDNDFNADKNKKSRYVKADLSHRNGGMMSEDTLRDFIAYSVLCGRKAKAEISAGFVAPTTIEGADACKYCPYKGMCASMSDKTERASVKVKCKDVARIANAALAGNDAGAEDGGDRG